MTSTNEQSGTIRIVPEPTETETIPNDPDDCGCAARQARLNEIRPGLGDQVKKLADPIQKGAPTMIKILIGVAIGVWVVPLAMKYLQAFTERA